MNLIPFESWQNVLAYAKKGATLYYQAPMDLAPRRLTPTGDEAPYPFNYQLRGNKIRIWPPGSIGRGKNRTSDPFNADAKHLERFSRTEEARGVGEKMRAQETAVLREKASHGMHARGAPQRQQRAGSFVVTLSTGQTARFHDMPRAQDWATQRLTGQPAGTYAAFYRAAVGPDRSDTGAPWTQPFHVLVVDEYGHVRVGDARVVAPLPKQHPHRSLSERHEITGPTTDGIYHYRGASIELSSHGRHGYFATVRFLNQEKDFEARSSEEALEKAKDWIDAAPELRENVASKSRLDGGTAENFRKFLETTVIIVGGEVVDNNSIDPSSDEPVAVAIVCDVTSAGRHLGAISATQGGHPDSALETAHEILEEWERETYQEDVSTETFDGRTWEIPVADFVKAIQGTDAAKFIELYE